MRGKKIYKREIFINFIRDAFLHVVPISIFISGKLHRHSETNKQVVMYRHRG